MRAYGFEIEPRRYWLDPDDIKNLRDAGRGFARAENRREVAQWQDEQADACLVFWEVEETDINEPSPHCGEEGCWECGSLDSEHIEIAGPLRAPLLRRAA